MGYSDKPKHSHLTPSRKKIGRILGRGNKGSLAATVLDPKNNVLQGKVIKCVGRLLNRELQTLCANKTPSMMQETSAIALEQFCWELVWEEITKKAPILVSLLQLSLPQKSKLDKKPVICMCVAMLAKFRNPKMCHVQAAISLILHAGHAGTQVSLYNIETDIHSLKLPLSLHFQRYFGDCRSV